MKRIAALLAVAVSLPQTLAQCEDFAEVEITLPAELYESIKSRRDTLLDPSDWEQILWMDEEPIAPSAADCQSELIRTNFPLTCKTEEGATPFLLRNVAKFLDTENFPHQGCALDYVLENAPAAALAKFTCEYNNQPANSAGCGDPKQLKDSRRTYQPETSPHQVRALNNLQTEMERNAPSVWMNFQAYWRETKVCVSWEVRADGRCGSDFGDAGCSPDGNSCCSPGGWCGNSELHCPPTAGAWDYKNGLPSANRATDIKGRFCKDDTGFTGVCVKESTCTGAGGTVKSLLCPGLPADVKCCQKSAAINPTYEVEGSPCSRAHPTTGGPGICVSTSDCSAMGGTSAAGLCPGASNIQCCAGPNIVPKPKITGERCSSAHGSGLTGVCTSTATCSLYGGTSDANKCSGPSDIRCCAGKDIVPEFSEAVSGSCGVYSGAQTFRLQGNGGVTYTVVKIDRSHLTNPSIYSSAPTDRDNTMTTDTACAFARMASAAASAGVYIKVSSGFRTVARQQYFYNCYQCRCCNGGNLAAIPGTSNHGRGVALDLNTDCGRQYGSRPSCSYSRVYTWLAANGARYGFQRAVQSEPWHWEYVGSGATKTWYT